jgi:hypothetical protein
MVYQMSDRKADYNKKGANGRDGMDGEDEAERTFLPSISPMPRTFSKANLALGNAKLFVPRGDSSGRSFFRHHLELCPDCENNLVLWFAILNLAFSTAAMQCNLHQQIYAGSISARMPPSGAAQTLHHASKGRYDD